MCLLVWDSTYPIPNSRIRTCYTHLGRQPNALQQQRPGPNAHTANPQRNSGSC